MPHSIFEFMNIEMKVVSPPNKDKTKRDGAAKADFTPPPAGDCTVKCPACGFVLYDKVSMDYLRQSDGFICCACGATISI
jgi:hypothetical protein